MTKPNENSWHTRGLTSLLSLAGFLVMSITGLVLYIVPHGRIAYWTDWTFVGLTKTHWGDIHILSSLLFVVAGAVHIYFNWKPLMNYLRNKATGGVKLKKELAVATVAVALVSVSAVAKLPPLSYLLDLNAAIKDTWVVSKDYEPPFGHAELLSLKVFCKKTDIDLDKALAELGSRGLKGLSPKRTVQQIAKDNGLSPLDLYRLIKRYERKAVTPVQGAYTAQKVEELFAGTGLGNKSITDIASRVGQAPATIVARLKGKGIDIAADEGLKAAATKNNLQPLDLLKAALVPGFRPER